ncbi:YycH family regulatory protein [Salsuginibacillus kocurii]|uniref:YycH family regulatory protein n=1 Tax=Salsuginibacillus kocurii TaxID=427078 RepID=UPI000382D08A|nr:two-component system activity regulator YycH [Salsuginibacillus kocurii]
MRTERIKSGVLTLLVLTSMWLTYELWSYQPDYSTIEHSEESYIETEPIGDEQEVEETIFPERIVFHDEENLAWLDGNDNRFGAFYEKLQDARFEELALQSDITNEEIYEEERIAEVIFPAPIPWTMLDELFEVEEDLPHINVEEIDRVLISEQAEGEDNLQIKLVSWEEAAMITGETSFSGSEFNEVYLDAMDELPEVFVYDPGDEEEEAAPLYLPEESVSYTTRSYSMSSLDAEDFAQVLFNDPDYTRHAGQEFQSDGNRMLDIVEDGGYMQYSNPVFSDNNSSSESHILTSGFDFINSHAGWTGNYQLFDWEEEGSTQSVSYRLQIEGLPVFSDGATDVNVIELEREGNQVSSYARPLFDIDNEAFDTGSFVQLESGEEILETIEMYSEVLPFEESDIENLSVGYEMEKQDLLATLTPRWYVQAHGNWHPIDVDELSEQGETENNGLE